MQNSQNPTSSVSSDLIEQQKQVKSGLTKQSSQGQRQSPANAKAGGSAGGTPKQGRNVLGKRLAKDTGISSSEQNLLGGHERSQTNTATASSNFNSCNSASLLTTPGKQGRMSVIKPTHMPGTLESSMKTAVEAPIHAVEVVEPQLIGGDANLDSVKSLDATMGRITTSSGPDVKQCAENQNTAQSNEIGMLNAPVASKNAAMPVESQQSINGPNAAGKESGLKERRARGRPKANNQAVKRSAKSGEELCDPIGKPTLSQRVKKQKSQVMEALPVVDDDDSDDDKKKDKKLVFLSRSVLQKVRERPMVTGTQIANEILEMYKKFCDIGQKVDFKNVQRRVYDALNVLSAMDIIRKDKYNIIYNHYNEHIPSDYGLYSSESDSDAQGFDSDKPAAMTERQQTNFADVEGGSNGNIDQVHQFSLTPPFVQQREKELFDLRKRIRDKQKLFLELIKQQVSITKLKERNIEVANSLLNDQEGGLNVDRSVAHSNQKLQLPLLFVECQPDSRIKISQDDTKMHLKLSTDRKFALSDENYLFECMGLTKTTSDELSRMFEPRIVDFLKQSELVQALPKHQQTGMGKPSTEGHQQSDVHCEDPHGLPSSAKLVGQHGGAAVVNAAAVGSQMHTPITKFLPSHSQQRQQFSEDYQQHHQAHTQQQSSYSQGPQHHHHQQQHHQYHQLSEPFFNKSGGKNNGAASGYIMHGGAPNYGGQESMGTQHSTVGSHHQQAVQFNQNLNTSASSLGASKKSNLSMSGLRV